MLVLLLPTAPALGKGSSGILANDLLENSIGRKEGSIAASGLNDVVAKDWFDGTPTPGDLGILVVESRNRNSPSLDKVVSSRKSVTLEGCGCVTARPIKRVADFQKHEPVKKQARIIEAIESMDVYNVGGL